MSEFLGEIRAIARQLSTCGPDEAWSTLVELEFAGIGLPEDEGGSGGTFTDLVALVEELARNAVHTPIIETSTAAWLTHSAPADLPMSIAGSDGLTTLANTAEGVLDRVTWAGQAQTLVLYGRRGVYTLDLSATGVELVAQPAVRDPVHSIRLDAAPVRLISPAPEPNDVTSRVATLRCAALIGAAGAALDLTRDYVKSREQFGAPLSTIPSVMRGLGTMSSELQLARAALAGLLRTDRPALSSVLAARVVASEAASTVAATAHQLHGAMGVAEEYPLHRHTTAIWDWRDADTAADELAQRLGAIVRLGGEAQLWAEVSA